MFVAEQRQRLWHPFRWDSTIVYSERILHVGFVLRSDNTLFSLRANLKEEGNGPESAF